MPRAKGRWAQGVARGRALGVVRWWCVAAPPGPLTVVAWG
jgi:hypothetical protein